MDILSKVPSALVAFERSGVVRRAFQKLGCEAYSCDLEPADDGERRWHIRGDVFTLGWSKFDIVVAHPPCTHICCSGARHFAEKRRDGRLREGIDTFLRCFEMGARRLCVENPVGIMSTRFRKPDQIIQPWQFGHGETKATCLWLKGLPALWPTCIVSGREARVHKMPPGPNRWKERSRTFEGVADAMAAQWGGQVARALEAA